MRDIRKPIPTSTLLRFPILFGSFLAIASLGLIYKESWMGDVEKSRREIFDKNNMENNPIDTFKRDVAAKR
ncbi:hypothetical protein TcasGA2_TC032239 [Tribolium castaneum]|uniref:Uncharacterized protein n=1 Tax=Tribolium castaneum TaxID=7070 RepID=A0A139WMZ7_TRICA|nr:hypothetical protein TcasGA2_TC032239 [Tribolium castaneum]